MESENKIEPEIGPENKKDKADGVHLFRIGFLVFTISIFVSALVGGFFGFFGGKIAQMDWSGFNWKKMSFEKKLNNNKNIEINQQKSFSQVVEEESAVIDSVEKASPAVVSIVITKDVPKLDSFFLDPFADDPFFNPFGFRQRRNDQQAPETEKREIGGGTGFIVDSDGYLITNNHVVSDPEAEYTVILNENEKVEAKVLATDETLDVAFLKIDKKNLPTVKMGDSDSIKIGQTVIAIGNSLGEFRNTVSKGIISGLKRQLQAGDGMGRSENLDEVIQTDAAINPGNSGGPLLDIQGNVIGVNVAMAQGAENIGFSIPINQVKKLFETVKNTGKLSRPYLGVRYVMVDDEIQATNKLKYNYGALILRGNNRTELAVIPGSPADKAGLEEYDIILEIDGVKLDEKNDLSKVIRSKEIGSQINLKIFRDGEMLNKTVTLEESK